MGATNSAISLRRDGRSLVIAVVGARGGAGTSTMAVALSRRLSILDPGRVLLIDGDPDHPNLDLALGVLSDGVDSWPSARLDHVLLRLGELAADGASLDRHLWSGEGAALYALLAPARLPVTAGPEHLDYLFKFQLAPRFDAIVVDLGSPGWELPALSRFWLTSAHWTLIVAKGTAADIRPTLDLWRRTAEVQGIRRLGVILTDPRRSDEVALRAQMRGEVDGIWTTAPHWLESAKGMRARTRWPRRAPDSDPTVGAVVGALISDSDRRVP